jgi:hypothetical protein
MCRRAAAAHVDHEIGEISTKISVITRRTRIACPAVAQRQSSYVQ